MSSWANGPSRLLLVLAGLWGCQRESAPQPTKVRVAAAADLSPAFEALGRDFEAATGTPLSFSFGSSGLLAKQIEQGAPFDVFAAANVSFVDQVIARGACDAGSKVPYARGRIALWTKRGGVVPPSKLDDLAQPRFVRIAIANPEHAPYGQAAREALQRSGIWEQLGSRLVLGENVRQTLEFGATGNADAVIVALALVIGDHENPWTLIDEGLHRPIDQALAVCRGGSNREGGAAFARFVASEHGRRVMRGFGFLLPGEKLTRLP